MTQPFPFRPATFRPHRRPAVTRCAVSGLVLCGCLAAQQFSVPQLLPGDATIAPSAGNQHRPAIARGGGGLSLVVWEDDRSSLVDSVFGGQALGSSIPGNFDIYGVLVDAQGQPVTAAPILVNGDTWDQRFPRVAWNGTDYLVVFESTKPTQFYYSRGIYAVRVSAAGTVLDTTAIRVDDDDPTDEMFPAVASLGGSWLVAWSDVGNNVTILQGALVSAAGVVGPAQTLVAGGVVSPPTELEMAAASGQYALAYSIGYGSGIRVTRVGPSMAPIGATLSLAAQGRRPAIATDGSGFYVAWMSGPARGTPVDAAGNIAVPGGAALGLTGSDSECAVGHDGTQWTVAIDATPDVLAVTVDAAGTPGAPITVATSSRSVEDIAVGDGVGNALVVWTDRRLTSTFGIDQDDLFAAPLAAAGAGAAVPISVSPPAQVAAAIAGEPATGFLCVYSSLDAGVTRFTAHALDGSGNSLGAPFVVHAGDRSLDRPDVAWNGSEFCVVWGQQQSTVSNGPPPLVFMKRVRIDGTILDPTPVAVMEGTRPAVDALDSVFLIVARYHHQVLQSNAVIRSRRVDGLTGTFLDSSPQLIAFGSGLTDVVGLGDRWLVAWGSVTAAYVLPTGTALTPFYAADTGSSSTRFRLEANAARDEAVLAYQYRSSLPHLTDVRLRRFSLLGTSPDPLLGPIVAAQNQAQLRPTAAALDGEYLVAWADHRDVLDYEPGLGDVYAARLTGAGVLLDANGIAVHDTPRAEGDAFLVRTGRGTALLVASTVVEGAFGTHRLQLSGYANAATTPWVTIGAPLAGSTVPTLAGYGPLTGGTAFDLTVADAVPGTLGVLALGLSAVNAPLFGGVLVPTPTATYVGVIDAAGQWTFAANWPAGWSGTSLYGQFWLLDAAGPQGFAATAGVQGTAP